MLTSLGKGFGALRGRGGQPIVLEDKYEETWHFPRARRIFTRIVRDVALT